MDISAILEGLNAAQREAVTTNAQTVRVIAGAGSGKTRVLVQRMQWLLLVENMSPYGLLALTFTNKAAREVSERLQEGLQRPLGQLWAGTFHGICHRILRRYAELMGWSRQFVIMDGQDQLMMVRRMMRARAWDEKLMNAKQLVWQINAYKEEGLRAGDVVVNNHPVEAAVREFYGDYERLCQQQATMDFAELLLLTVELLREHEGVCAEYRARFQALLVDEFQDTNKLQFEMVRLLCGAQAQLFVVGDDDQSIYGWRGARVENILSLEEVYPDLQTIRLEQNYRSTQTILDAANAVIAKNSQRLGKRLWSEGDKGSPVTIYPAVNEYDEARYVCEAIRRWQEAGGRYQDCAVLYRSNAQSRVFEELFLQYQVPYRVYGGLRFFERAEVKDALAYLRVARFADDDGAIERIINTPARGIGAKTLALLRGLAQMQGLSLWQAMQAEVLAQAQLSGRGYNAVQGFVQLINVLLERINATSSLKEALHIVVHDSGLYQMHEDSGKEQAAVRRENLDELINAGSYVDSTTEADSDRIMDFLANAALDAGDGQAQEGVDCVQLMTLHSAKGLEFPNVYIVGMEEDLFPSQRSIAVREKLEEERRLAYVGMTRAERELTLCFAERRRLMGNDTYPRPSRFIYEIPEALTEAVRPLVYAGISEARLQVRSLSEDSMPFKTGDMVKHRKFGEGCVLMLEGSGDHARALINFEQAGEKWLVLTYAKLEKL